MNSLTEKVRETALKHGMFLNTSVIYTALSGGADSVALHLALRQLSKEYGFSLKAVHVNHMIRGEEADRDCQFCMELCKKLDTEISVFSVNVPEYAEKHHLSTEEAARHLRYDCFEKLDEQLPYKIATAHSLNDSAETVMFNLSRGTGIKGLTGIPPVRDRMIRPLISCTREEIEAFLSENGQDFVTDSTNLSDDYTRNKIRHRLIPLMEEIHGGFHGNIRRMTENLADDCDYLEQAALKAMNGRLSEMHPAIRRRVIINLLKQHNIEVNAERISAAEKIALCKNGGKINLSGNIYAVAKDGILTVKTIKERIMFPEKKLLLGENDFLCDKKVIIKENNCEIQDKNGIINKKFTENLFDCDKIQGELFLRNRRDGDSYRRSNRNFTSSLKKLMQEKYPAEERDLIPVIADSEGIIWTEGFGIADRVRISENTLRYCEISVIRP